MSLSRRAFLGGSAATVGGLALAEHLRFFQPLSAEAAAEPGGRGRPPPGRSSSTAPATPITATVPVATSCTWSMAG